MPSITRIVKNNNQYDLYLDDHFFLKVNEDTLVNFQLLKGSELSNDDLIKLKKFQFDSLAYEIALNKLSYSMRTIGEMRQILRREAISTETINSVIERLIKQKYLDDAIFANLYFKELLKTTHYGPKIFKYKMQKKLLSSDLIDQVMLNYSLELEESRVRKEFDRIFQKINLNSSAKNFVQKQKAKLVRSGYGLSIIDQVISEYDLSILKETEEDTILKEGAKLLRRYQNSDQYAKKQKVKQALYRKGYSSEAIAHLIEYFNL